MQANCINKLGGTKKANRTLEEVHRAAVILDIVWDALVAGEICRQFYEHRV